MTKVSVVVPVFEPGPRIDRCIDSILGQSMPPGDLEAVFVDDGSSDGTPERLARLAAEHPHVRFERIPNSGWPSRPRNVGTELATGEYVLYMDNDDWLDRRAAERLHARAVADEADIVIGKVVGHRKNVPRELFARNRSGTRLEEWPPLLGLLSPHKLFRRALLDEHGIRFPEDRRYLEDHHFVVHAYFHARRISVLADHPIYHWVKHDDGNASFGRLDADEYYASLRRVLDLVEEHTEPGPLRDRLLAHWYRHKVLWRAGGANLLQRRPEVRPDLHEQLRALARERFGERLDALVPFNLRVRARVLREGTLEDLERLAEWEGRLEPDVQCAAGSDLHVRASLPLVFERAGDRLLWRPPAAVAEVLPPGADLDATEDLERSHADVYVKSRRNRAEHLLELAQVVRVQEDGRPVLEARGALDPATAAAGRRLRPGGWRVGATVRIAGFRGDAFPLHEFEVQRPAPRPRRNLLRRLTGR